MTLQDILPPQDLMDVINYCQHSLIDESEEKPLIVFRGEKGNYFLTIDIPGWDDVYAWHPGANVENVRVDIASTEYNFVCSGESIEQLDVWFQIMKDEKLTFIR